LISLPNPCDLLLSSDSLVEGVHFTKELFSPYDIGWKSSAVNISDMAAMAADPLYMLVNISLPKSLENKDSWLLEFYRGLCDCNDKHGSVKVIGGDLTGSLRDIFISVSIIGKADARGVIFRSSARAGQFIAVSGKFGNSNSYLNSLKAGLEERSSNPEDEVYFLRPRPRLLESKKILELNDSSRVALMDSSDGLAQALFEIAEQSKVCIEIDFNAIPKDPHVSLNQALYGGEDYELVASLDKVPTNFTILGRTLEASNSKEVYVYDKKSKQKLKKNEIYRHF
jgi:thiamine-monophosphate kinase